MSEQERDEIIELDIDRDGDLEPISEREPMELAREYLAEAYGETGWVVDQVAGDADFGMVEVVLGRYDASTNPPELMDTAEGRGTDIPAAVDDAMERAEG